MVNKRLLFWLGLYLFLDGAISIYHFRETGTDIEHFFRIVRALIGVLLMIWGKR